MEGSLVYFSPAGSTKKLVEHFAPKLFTRIIAAYDITLPAHRNTMPSFTQNDVLLAGIPVYGGRVPDAARDTFASLRGNKTPAVLVAVYGNRDYDDALFELRDIVEQNGFLCVAAAAIVAEHSIVRAFGSGRPDQRDLALIDEFAAKIRGKLTAWNAQTHTAIHINGSATYRAYQRLPIHPRAGSTCIRCGLCAEQCPASAIPPQMPNKTDTSLCITCMRCVQVCPSKARRLGLIAKLLATKSLKAKCRERKEPQLFV